MINWRPKEIEIELVDPRTIVPLDRDTICASVRKTGRLVTVDEANRTCGIGSEIAALAAEDAFAFLKSPVVRVARADVPVAYSRPLEDFVDPESRGHRARGSQGLRISASRSNRSGACGRRSREETSRKSWVFIVAMRRSLFERMLLMRASKKWSSTRRRRQLYRPQSLYRVTKRPAPRRWRVGRRRSRALQSSQPRAFDRARRRSGKALAEIMGRRRPQPRPRRPGTCPTRQRGFCRPRRWSGSIGLSIGAAVALRRVGEAASASPFSATACSTRGSATRR